MPAYAVASLEHGSPERAYLLNERVGGVDELARAIRTVAGGGSVIDPLVVGELVSVRARRATSSLSSLTPREPEILAEPGVRRVGAPRAGVDPPPAGW